MLLSALLAPLLVAGITPARQTQAPLLRLAPDDALATLQVPDVPRLLSRRETNRWAAFVTDPTWRRVVADLRGALDQGVGAEGAPAEAPLADLFEALGESEGAVAMVVGDPGTGEAPVLALGVRGGDAVHGPLLALLRGKGRASREGDLEVWAADEGFVEAYLRRGDLHLVVHGPDAARATEFGRAALARLDSGAPLGGRLAAFRDVCDVEASIDLRGVWRAVSADPGAPPAAGPFLAALASVEWLHARLELGAGEHLDLVVEAPYAQAGLAQRLFGALLPCEPALLGLAPSMAISTSAGRADVGALARAVLTELEASAQDTHGLATAALDSVRDALGIDPLDDLVANLTGDYVSFSLPPDMVGAAEATTADGRANALDVSCTAFGLKDAEPFRAAIEAGLELAAGRVDVAASTLRGADLWSLDVGGRALQVALHPRFLCLAFDVEALEAFLARVDGDADAPPSFLAKPRHAEAAQDLRGTYVSLAPTRSAVAFLGETSQVLGLSFVAAGEAELERFGAALRDAGHVMESLAHLYFSGLLRGQLTVEGGRVVARTEAR